MSLPLRKSLALLLAVGALAVTPTLVSFAAQPPAAQGETAPAAAAPADAAAPAADAAATTDSTAGLDPLLAGANIERGKQVFAKVGVCVSCHGWDGDGTGKNPRSEGQAALLRESALDAQGFIEIISCGIPGTPMPYHDNQAYKDDRCYGMKAADFEPGQEPHKGKSIKHEDIINLVAYIQTHLQGKPAATYEDCAYYFEASADKACAFMKK